MLTFAIDTIKKLSSTSSSNEKQEILKSTVSHPSVDLLKKVFDFAYNPKIRFYLKPFDKEDLDEEKFAILHLTAKNNPTDLTIFQVLEKFATREATGDQARILYLSLKNQIQSSDEWELFNNILEKDLKCGVSTTTINKIFPKLIPTMGYMRCSLVKAITDKEKPKWHNPVISQEKMDGMFVNVNVSETGVQFLSRAGTEIPELNALNHLFKLIETEFEPNHQYHGELLMFDKTGEILPRQISNGLFNTILKSATSTNSTQKATDLLEKDGYVPFISFWDKVHFDVLDNEKSNKNVAYVERLESLKKDIHKTELLDDSELLLVKLVDTRHYPSIFEAHAHFEQMLAENKEGTVVKLPSMKWKNGTSKEQIKLKNEFQIELQIKEFLDGTGKNEQFFGSIRCVSADGKLSVNVPVSGFDDKLKAEVSNNRDDYLDKILTVRANSIMPPTSNNNQYSLFLPVFIEFRLDKSEADDLQKIQDQYESSKHNALNAFA